MATVQIDFETARLIQAAFLPRNENKMRGAAPEVVAAVKTFKKAVSDAREFYGITIPATPNK